jgi:hypothetical protein
LQQLKKRPRRRVGSVDQRRGIVPRSYGIFDVRGLPVDGYERPASKIGVTDLPLSERRAGAGLAIRSIMPLWLIAGGAYAPLATPW